MNNRIYNFSAGPATMPIDVLQNVQNEFTNYQQQGMSIIEMSHRSSTFKQVLERAKQGIITLLNIPDDYDVLFIQGGASLQFSMSALNLVHNNLPVKVINTGVWTKKAIKEIKKETQCDIIASSEDKNFNYIPNLEQCNFDNASYVYLCSNNTIFGTQYTSFPDTKETPLVADMSSDILSRPLDISKFGLIFAGAQKNIGPSGVAIVIIKKELVKRCDTSIPSMLQYQSYIDSDSLYNTAPTFAIYMISLIVDQLQQLGGISYIQTLNEKKAALLYDFIDNSDFYYCPTNPADRSKMNVVFRIHKGEDSEKEFVSQASAAKLDGLKGHRLVGGLRASIYNAMPMEGVEALISFMKTFEQSSK